MIIAIASDHAGVSLKAHLIARLSHEHSALDLGPATTDSVDYPRFAERVARCVLEGQAEKGILICGTGIGMAIAANKMPGIRASVVHDSFSARASVEHNNLNILTLGARVIGSELAWEVIQAFLAARFVGGRHQERLALITALERQGLT